MSTIKRIVGIFALGIELAIAAALLFSCAGFQEQARVRALEIGQPSLAGIADGSYVGRYAYGSYEYAVSVDIAGERITAVKILANRDTSHALAAEGVLARILEKQSPDVDAVSGSTTTSKALMKAVENAIESAPRN
jgi:Uncharacterized protein conserved in bacteria